MDMRKALSASLLALALLGLAGCCSCPEVPVDFECFCNWLHNHGPDCRHYPNSCPPCPYWDYECHVWRAPCCECETPSAADETPRVSDASEP